MGEIVIFMHCNSKFIPNLIVTSWSPNVPFNSLYQIQNIIIFSQLEK